MRFDVRPLYKWLKGSFEQEQQKQEKQEENYYLLRTRLLLRALKNVHVQGFSHKCSLILQLYFRTIATLLLHPVFSS